MLTVVYSPSVVFTLSNISLTSSALHIIQPDLTWSTSICVADVLTSVSDTHTVFIITTQYPQNGHCASFQNIGISHFAELQFAGMDICLSGSNEQHNDVFLYETKIILFMDISLQIIYNNE